MMGRLIEWLVIRVLARVFPSRYRLIPRAQDGKPLLRQFKIFSWCYLQSFVSAEVMQRFHVHRWRYMLSFVLSGEFAEERYPGTMYIIHTAPSVYQMDDTVVHRFARVAPNTWTLFFMFGKNRHELPGDWGYFQRPHWDSLKYQPWDQEIPEERRVKSL